MTRVRAAFERLKSENGTTLIEVAVASAILLVVMTGLMGMATMYAVSAAVNTAHAAATPSSRRSITSRGRAAPVLEPLPPR